MNNLPKISIITPSYNQADYLEQTILSVIEQGYPNYELIVMDGGSTDHSVDIIRKYESFITYWVSDPDKGQADAIQKGLNQATGDIFNWINSDDYLEPGALLTIGNFFLQNPDKQALCGYTRCFYTEDNTTSHTYQMGVSKTATDTLLNIAMNQPGTFYRTEAVQAVGGICSSLRYIFDNELWFRFLNLFGTAAVGFTEALLAQFRLHKTSKSVYEGYALFERESKAIWTWMAKTYQFHPALCRLLMREEQASPYLSDPWRGNQVDFTEVEAYWCFYYMLSLMQQGHIQLARKGFLYAYQKKQMKLSRKNMVAGIKLFILPGLFKS
jgi:glycosyltransferase involved in cell wall biosynthesis